MNAIQVYHMNPIQVYQAVQNDEMYLGDFRTWLEARLEDAYNLGYNSARIDYDPDLVENDEQTN